MMHAALALLLAAPASAFLSLDQNAQDLAGIQGTFTKLTTGVSGRDLDFLFENVYAGNGDTTTFYVWEVRKQALAKYEGVAGITDFFNKLWQIQSPENDPRIKAIEFVPRTQQIVYVWESPADDIIEEAASFSMIREEDYKVASVWLAFNGPPFPES
mmetsp:Transcript_43144/g.94472  ORF Transcript_43144/g.94472 Transcript_43144/m.94472 type:complete len:157 (-) Transcript_43144:177-647(-)